MTGVVSDARQTSSRAADVSSGWNAVTRPCYRALLALWLLAVAGAGGVEAQPAVVPGTIEWAATVSAARGIAVLQSTGGDRYLSTQLSWGRVLTDLRGPAWLRGRFEWNVEVVPAFAEWSSGKARGVGLSPLGWRWNLAPHGRLLPYAEVGGGALWTSRPIPDGTTGSNFTSYAGLGVRVMRAGGIGLVAGYRLHHISNGNRLRQNPGVNAHMVTVGLTHLGPR